MRKQAVCVAAALALALAADPALARSSRGGGGGGGRAGGGGHPGGGHSGGGYAVPRGGGGGGHSGYASQGAAARHPSAGTRGAAAYHYGGRYPGYGYGHYPAYGHGHYGGYYGGRYGAYYGGYGGYYGYYGSPYLSLSFGWPYAYGASSYWYPSDSYTYVPAPYEGTYRVDDRGSYRAEAEVRDDGGSVPNTGRVRLEVRPDDASVYVDDEFWGTASASRFITLRAGRHTIELVRPGFAVSRQAVEVVPGETSDVLIELQR